MSVQGVININDREIKVGDVITVEKWTSHMDNSWVGDLLEVIAIDKPFYAVKYVRNEDSCLGINSFVLNTGQCVLKKLSKEFVSAMIEAGKQ